MHKNYIGRTNRNGTKMTRATYGWLAPELRELQAERRRRRVERWEISHYPDTSPIAPRHIREKDGIA